MVRKAIALAVLLSFAPFVGACTTYHTAGEKFFTGEWNTFIQSMESSLKPGATTMEEAKKFFPTEPIQVQRTSGAIVWVYHYQYDESTKTSKVVFGETRKRGDEYKVVLVFSRSGILTEPYSSDERILDFLQEPMTETLVKYAVVGGAIVFGGIMISNEIKGAIGNAASGAGAP